MISHQIKPVQSNPDFPQLEQDRLKFWHKNGVVEKYLNKNNSSKKKFFFLDGPITANGPMGVHHAWGRTYKDLWQIELAFRQLKSELEMGPIYHWKDRRIRAHIMICFLAFVLRTVLYKKLKDVSLENKVSYSQTVGDLKSLQTCELEVGETRAKVRTEMKSGATLAMKAIGMRPPNRIL